MMSRRRWLLLTLTASMVVMLLLATAPAFAAVNVQLISVTPPTGLNNTPPDCGGDIDVTFRYGATQPISFDYTVDVTGFPPFSGTIALPATPGGAMVTQTLTFNIPIPLLLNTPIDATVTAFDITQTIQLDADAVNFFCQNGYTAPTPPPSSPSIEAPAAPPGDGRLEFSNVFAAVYYDGDGTIEVYTIDENGNGVLALRVTETELESYPEFPTTNILIASNADGTVALYKLTTGEYQLNLGPDHEGKVKVIVFTTFPSLSWHATEFDVIP